MHLSLSSLIITYAYPFPPASKCITVATRRAPARVSHNLSFYRPAYAREVKPGSRRLQNKKLKSRMIYARALYTPRELFVARSFLHSTMLYPEYGIHTCSAPGVARTG